MSHVVNPITRSAPTEMGQDGLRLGDERVGLFIGQLCAPLRITDDFGFNHFKYHSCDLTIGVTSTLYFFFLSALLTTKDTFMFQSWK